MAFQVGDIKISGTIDDLSFYNSVFGWLVRQKGGPTRKQFKISPSYARARENSSEFTLCSQAASSIRKLVIKHTGIKDKTLYHRLMKLTRLLADADQTSVRRKRDPLKGIHTEQGKKLLKDFGISEELNLYTILVSAGIIKTKPLLHTLRKRKKLILTPIAIRTPKYILRWITLPLIKTKTTLSFYKTGEKHPELII